MSQYIVISESTHYGWLCDYITLNNAKKLLKKEDIVVYIFKLSSTKMKNIKLKYPFNQYYSCLQINNIITLNNNDDDDDDEYVEINLLENPEIKFMN